MENIRSETNNGVLTIFISGRVDSNNAQETEAAVNSIVQAENPSSVIIDFGSLDYISSAGLRIILHLKKMISDLKLINVNSDVYEVFDMTGFTQMMTVEKAYRVVSIEGCEVVGKGANGTLYRIDEDNVVKVYNNADALNEIQHEREVARLALVLGIPTAISYDVVRVGDSYGSVFELLSAKSFAKIISTEPDKFDWCVDEFAGMLKKIHSTVVPAGKLPEIKQTVLGWVDFMKDYLPEDAYNKLKKLVSDVPDDNHMIHGDYHTKNLELTRDEVLTIDMDTLSVGNPIFELGSMYNAFIGFSEQDHEIVKRFQGFDFETAKRFWFEVLKKYLGTDNEKKIKEVEDKARIVGYTRLIRRSIRRGGLDVPEKKEHIEYWTQELLDLLGRVNTLSFLRNEMEIEALKDNLPQVLEFIDLHLESADCPMKPKLQIDLAVEEIFVNIANYAYGQEMGRAVVRIEVSEEPICVTVTFIDNGIPYDPLAKEDPDITLSAEERQIGGLGIFMVKSTMDDVIYDYKDGQNILKLKKNI